MTDAVASDVSINELLKVVRENERMRTALVNIKSYAANAVFGGWRSDVYQMADNGLKRE